MLPLSTRLPGVLCETRVPNLGRQPLRLDVAAFVGLAERGPLDAPVLIEDFSQYRLIFGGDLPVARADGQPVFAHLPRTVEAFFENGGRRCYVVRVAGAGNRTNQFQIPGLLQDVGEEGWQPPVVPAAWPGRWSDLVSLATTLRVLPLQLREAEDGVELPGDAINGGDYVLNLRLPAPGTLRAGDLLRLHLRQAGVEPVEDAERYHLYVRVASVVEAPALTALQLFGTPVDARPAAESAHLFRTNPDTFAVGNVAQLGASGWVDLPFDGADYEWTAPEEGSATYRLTMPLAVESGIEPGTLLRIDGGGGEGAVFFSADVVQRGVATGGSGDLRVVVDGDEPLQVTNLLPTVAHVLTQVDVLSFDLLVREGDETLERWQGLRFAAGASYWLDVLQPPIDYGNVDPASFTVDHFANRSLRLGAAGVVDGLPLPLGMSALAAFVGPQLDALATSKDGLDVFDPAQLFVDADLAATGWRALPEAANDLLYLAPEPRRLRGLHSVLPVDEAALIAIPDLAHLGWEQVDPPLFSEPEPEEEEPEEPKGFHDCPPPPPEVDEDDEVVPALLLGTEVSAATPSSQAWLEDLPEQVQAADHDGEAMLDVQRALVRLCAARADMVALLSLPQAYDVQAVGQWRDEIAGTPEFFDGNPLSYAAVYHGWPGIREETTPSLAPLRYAPPDGFVAGMIAAREIRRGPWIAPANVALETVVALQPAFDDGHWATLFGGQVNVVRRQPGRYALMSAMTLARERSLRQLNVRRLLILLRKLALREGQRYVFETNNERFRTLVQTYFENILNQILERGGLQDFQVVTNEEINTRNDYENGRFLIALKVAPTLPIEFITITMLRSGDEAIDIVER